MATETETFTTETLSLALRGSTVPLKSSGKLLSTYKHFDTTPVLGTQFDSALQLSQIIDDDDLIKDLAVLVSERNVAFFKAQDITPEQQKRLGQRLGKLSGNPEHSELHYHPTTRDTDKLGKEIYVIANETAPKDPLAEKPRGSAVWHSDITYEPVPSDFALLKIHTLPDVGGDTIWASSTAAFDKLTPHYQKFLEGLTAVHEAPNLNAYAENRNYESRTDARGSPLNTGGVYRAVHPVIRTNPITGWKSIFANELLTKRIIELNKDESDNVLNYLNRVINDNHDIHLRYTWSKDDVAIWSNASSHHKAIYDVPTGSRIGDRVVSIGEKPYLDPASTTRAVALGIKA